MRTKRRIKKLISKLQSKSHIYNTGSSEGDINETKIGSTPDQFIYEEVKSWLAKLGYSNSEIEKILDGLSEPIKMELIQALLKRRETKHTSVSSSAIG